MVFPLATFTAESGLAWFYDKSAIAFGELDRCRRLLGALPDFDSGDKGYEGVGAVGRRIYLMRCTRADAWDFKGRDAVYLTVTWLDRDKAAGYDLDAILSSDGMCAQSHDYKYCFELDGGGVAHGDGGIASGVDLSRAGEEDVFIRRDFGESKPTVRIERKGADKMTEAEKFLGQGGQAVADADNGTAADANQPHKIEFSMAARIFGVILFVLMMFLGTYLARISGHVLLGYIAGAAGFGLLGALWRVRR